MIRWLVISWHDRHQDARCGCVLVALPGVPFSILQGTECLVASERWIEILGSRRVLAREFDDGIEIRTIDLPQVEPIGPTAEDYWRRAKPLPSD